MDPVAPLTPNKHALPHLPRPLSPRRRWVGRLARLRLVWRRLAAAVLLGLSAAGVTVGVLSSWPPATDSPDGLGAGVAPVAEITDSEVPGPSGTRSPLDEHQRVVAVDRQVVALPVSPGDRVEIVGLRPTITDMESEVISPNAEVIGVSEEAVLVLMDDDEAHRFGEVAANGSILILGLDHPGDVDTEP